MATAGAGLRGEGARRLGSLLPLVLACAALVVSVVRYLQPAAHPHLAPDRDLLRAQITGMHQQALALQQRLLDLGQRVARTHSVRVQVPALADASVEQQLQSRLDLLWIAVLSAAEGVTSEAKTAERFIEYLTSLAYYRKMAQSPMQLPQERVMFLHYAARFPPQSVNFDEDLRRVWAELVPQMMGDAAMLHRLGMTAMSVGVDDIVRPGLITMIQDSRVLVRDVAMLALRNDLSNPTVRRLFEHMASTDPSPGLRADAQSYLNDPRRYVKERGEK